MTPILYLVAFFTLPQARAGAFSNGQIQPGVYPAPALPSNFTKSPIFWQSLPAPRTVSREDGDLLGRQSGKVWSEWQNIRYMFTFGDSYTSTGFDHDGTQPNPDNPLGNPSYPGATSSNGPNYVDFLATTYNRSYIQTFNLGYGGATIDPALVASPYGRDIQSFEQQVTDTFLPIYAVNEAVPWIGNDTLFTIFFGINDVMISYATGNDSLNYDLIKRYESLVNRLYTAGARNFVFLNVPPVDRSPATLIFSAFERSFLAEYLANFNFRLRSLVYYLGRRRPDTTLFFFDTNWLFTRVMDNPLLFAETAGYKNTTEDCGAYVYGTPELSTFFSSCGVPVDQYLWVNDLHPTYPIHNLIARRIVQLFDG